MRLFERLQNIESGTEEYIELSHEFQIRKEGYIKKIKEHERLKAEIMRLEARRKKFGVLDDKGEEKIRALDQQCYTIHREIEEIGEDIGKGRHEVSFDITAYRYSCIPETRIRGLLVVPYQPPDHSDHPEDVLIPETAEGTYFEISKNIIREGINTMSMVKEPGYVLIYGMTHSWSGEDYASTTGGGTEYDKALPLKQKRIDMLQQIVKKKMPDVVCTPVHWQASEGGFHNYDNTDYLGLFVDERHFEHVIELMKARPEEVWMTDSEYEELGQVIVTEFTKGSLEQVADMVSAKGNPVAAHRIRELNKEFDKLQREYVKRQRGRVHSTFEPLVTAKLEVRLGNTTEQIPVFCLAETEYSIDQLDLLSEDMKTEFKRKIREEEKRERMDREDWNTGNKYKSRRK